MKTDCHPERKLERSLRQSESKDLRLLFTSGLLLQFNRTGQ
jgi:hypothetical protein